MDLHKLKAEEVRSWDAGKRRETERDVRKALVDIRMDVFTPRNQHAAKLRGLKKSLARILTVEGAAKLKEPVKGKSIVAKAKPEAKKATKTKTK